MVQLHMQRRDTAAAEQQLQALEALQPGNGFLCYSRGLLAQQEGQLVLARQWYEKGMRAPGGAGWQAVDEGPVVYCKTATGRQVRSACAGSMHAPVQCVA